MCSLSKSCWLSVSKHLLQWRKSWQVNTGHREIVQRPEQGSKDLNSSAGLNALSSRQGIISYCPKGNLAVSISFSHITVPFLSDFLNFLLGVNHSVLPPLHCFSLLLSHQYSVALIAMFPNLNESKASSSHPKPSSYLWLQTWRPRGSGRLWRMNTTKMQV